MLRIFILSFFISSIALANENPHTIALEYSYSSITNGSDTETSDLNDLMTTHYSYAYQYKLAEHFSIGLGYLKGDSSNTDGVLVDIFTDSSIDYSAIMLSAKVNYPVSKRNYLYLSVDALKYDYDILDDNEIKYSEKDNDFGFSLGWGYKFDNGIGISAGYEVVNLGKHIRINGVSSGINYRF
jgi:long-subunit fatty acid transport protein